MSSGRLADPALRARSIQAHFRYATKEPVENVKFFMSEEDINCWYVLLHNFDGSNNEYINGEYLVKLDIGPATNFPFDPPHFEFMTANGVFMTFQKVCISIGEYHKANYPPAMKMRGFIIELMNGLIGWKTIGSGIGIYKTSVDEKRRLANRSRGDNWRKYPDLMQNISDCYEAYSAKWDLSKIAPDMRERMRLQKPAETADVSNEALAESAANLSIDDSATNGKEEEVASL